LLFAHKGTGYLIELPGREGVLCPQQLVKIVRPEVIADVREYGNPHIGFDPILLAQRLALL